MKVNSIVPFSLHDDEVIERVWEWTLRSFFEILAEGILPGPNETKVVFSEHLGEVHPIKSKYLLTNTQK